MPEYRTLEHVIPNFLLALKSISGEGFAQESRDDARDLPSIRKYAQTHMRPKWESKCAVRVGFYRADMPVEGHEVDTGILQDKAETPLRQQRQRDRCVVQQIVVSLNFFGPYGYHPAGFRHERPGLAKQRPSMLFTSTP